MMVQLLINGAAKVKERAERIASALLVVWHGFCKTIRNAVAATTAAGWCTAQLGFRSLRRCLDRELPTFPLEGRHGVIKARETCTTETFRSIRVTGVRAEGGKIMTLPCVNRTAAAELRGVV